MKKEHLPRDKQSTWCGRKLSGQQTSFEWRPKCSVCVKASLSLNKERRK